MEYFYNQTKEYEWNDGIPKQKLFVKLVDGISASDRSFVANGIRSFFNDLFTQLLEKSTIVDSLEKVNKVFTILVWLIGVISLCIAFFLLLIATT